MPALSNPVATSAATSSNLVGTAHPQNSTFLHDALASIDVRHSESIKTEIHGVSVAGLLPAIIGA